MSIAAATNGAIITADVSGGSIVATVAGGSIIATVPSVAPSAATAVSGGAIVATVPSGGVSATVAGGIGPQGPAGGDGDGSPPTALGSLSDVEIAAATDGDVLRYNGSSSKWANYAELDLVDGGNFLWLIASGFAGPLALLLQRLS